MADWIRMPSWMMSGIGRRMGVLDEVPHLEMGRGCFWRFYFPLVWMAFFSVFLKQKCIQLVH